MLLEVVRKKVHAIFVKSDYALDGIGLDVKYSPRCNIKYVVTLDSVAGNKAFFVMNIANANDENHIRENLNAAAERLTWY